jgi:TonB family protein
VGLYSVGEIVFLSFPFSDLTASNKLEVFVFKRILFSLILSCLVSSLFGQSEVPLYSIGQKIPVGDAYLTVLGTQKSSKSFSDGYIPAKGNILIAVNIEFETTAANSLIDAFQSSQITGKNGVYFPTSYGVRKPILEDFSSTLRKTQFWQTFEIPIKETNLVFLYQTSDLKLISFSLNSQSKSSRKVSIPPIVWDKDNEPIVISRAETSQRRTTLKPKSTAKITKKVTAVQLKSLPTKPIAKKIQTQKSEIIKTLAEEPVAVAPSSGIYRIGQRIPSGNFILSLTDWEIKKSSYIETYQVPGGKFMVALKLRIECLDEKICDSLAEIYSSRLIGRIESSSNSTYGRKLPDLLSRIVSKKIKRGESLWYEKIGWLTFEVNETDANFTFLYIGSKVFRIDLNNNSSAYKTTNTAIPVNPFPLNPIINKDFDDDDDGVEQKLESNDGATPKTSPRRDPYFEPTEKDGGIFDAGSAREYATQVTEPTYPSIAKSMRMTGTVKIDFVIDEKGNVATIFNTTGPDLLKRSSIDALKKWKFKPFEKDGVPVKAIGFIEFNFEL